MATQVLKMQLNSAAEINRDLQVHLVNEATGQETVTTPFLDGSLVMRNVAPGSYRVKVQHPNLVAPAYDGRIRVFGDRPTFVPVQIPTDIFSNTPIATPTQADLGPTRAKLGTAAAGAEGLTNKKGGQPIYADDWNQLGGITSDVAQTVLELSQKVAPLGHDHPELVAKMTELQGNLDKLLGVFGQTLTAIERQINQLALQVWLDQALGKLGVVDRSDFTKAMQPLADGRQDTPYIYTSTARRVGEALVSKLAAAVPASNPGLANDDAVVQVRNVALAMASAQPVFDYTGELQFHAQVSGAGKTSGVLAALTK